MFWARQAVVKTSAGRAGTANWNCKSQMQPLDLAESITLHNIHYALIRYQLQGLTSLQLTPQL